MAFNYKFLNKLTNATTNVDETKTYSSSESVTIEIKANDGYHFTEPPWVGISNGNSSFVLVKMVCDDPDTAEYKQNYHGSLSQMTIWTSGVTEANSPFILHGDAQPIPVSDKYGIIQMYNPTPAELKDIGKYRYYSEQSSAGIETVDLGKYISSLIRVFVKIPEQPKAAVILGGYNTGVMANALNNDIVETDCGSVEIVGKYGNAMDYENTTVEIYLPLIGFRTLDTVKVMNETLTLFYKTNVINGDTIACIYNGKGTLLYTFNSKAGFDIPYILDANHEQRGVVEVNANYLYGFTPFVTVRVNKAYNAAAAGANDDRETTLEGLTGFVKCSEVFNTVRATSSEEEEIDRLLKEGVIIT